MSLELLGDSYARELARALGAPVSGIQKALRTLERDGLVAGRSVGRTRLVRLNPAYVAAAQLRPLLRRLADGDEDLQTRLATLRRRPRRGGKPL